MKRKLIAAVALSLLLLPPAALLARQSVLRNGSYEFGGGPSSEDPHVPAGWTRFGPTVERSDEANLTPPGPGHALKAFSSDPQVGAYQEVPAVAGNAVTINASLYTRAADKLSGDAHAGIVLEFYSAANQLLSSFPLFVLDLNSPADTWVPGSVGPRTAPANTAKARFVAVWIWSGSAAGSAFWDDAQLTINGGPNLLTNGDFEIAGQGENSPTGIDDWQGFNDQQKSLDTAYDGVASLQLGTTNDYSGLYQDMAALTAGQHLYMKGWAWNPSSDPLVANSAAGLKLEFNPNGTVPPAEEHLTFNQTNDPNTWTLVTYQTTVPTDITVARVICIFVGDPNTTGSVHFDAADAERGSLPGINQLLNSSFEDGTGGPNGIDNWTEFGTTTATTRLSCFAVPAFSGDCTARSTGPSVTGVYQQFSVTPGEALSFQVYCYTSGTDRLTGPGVAGVKIEWRFGSVPPGVDIGPDSNTVHASSPHDTWIPLHIDYTMPAGSNAIARFTNLIARGTAATGRAYLDGCEAVLLNVFNGSDADGDNDEDLLDFAQLQPVYSGSGGGLRWNALVFDSDNDGDVDFADYTYFAQRITGPNP